MTDPIRLRDAIAALLPALRPASGPGTGHLLVMRLAIIRACGETGMQPFVAGSLLLPRTWRHLPRRGQPRPGARRARVSPGHQGRGWGA